ncbi:MAG TPA: CrcB family protein [Opitutales bacterium]|nr:CrcB family protein [Opitutales bacterium]
MRLFWIGLGSGLGGSLRYALDLLAATLGAGTFPFSTLLINVSGSLLIGFLAGLWAAGGAAGAHPHKWHFWMTGFCGGYTTFSAFSWQLFAMIGNGQAQLAGIYAACSIAFGLIAVWVGLSWATAKNEERERA